MRRNLAVNYKLASHQVAGRLHHGRHGPVLHRRPAHRTRQHLCVHRTAVRHGRRHERRAPVADGNGWAETVGPDDEVWTLGDLAMGRIEDSLPLVAALPGRKILVPGNHDRCWAGAKNPGRWLTTYRDDAGIDTIVGAPARVRLGAGRLLADHFPYTGDSRAEDRYGPWRPADHGGWLIHGHVHNAWRQRGRQINVGVGAWAGRPVPSSVVVAMICAGPAELDPLPWR